MRCEVHAILHHYVSRAVGRQLEATGAANVGGVQRAVGDGMAQRAVAMAMTSPIGVGDARYGGAAGASDTVYLGNFQAPCHQALRRTDGSQPGTGAGYQATRPRRHRVVRSDVVDYTPRRSLRALARQYFDYGVGKQHMLSYSPTRCGGASWQHRCWWLGSPDRPDICMLGTGAAAHSVVPGVYVVGLAAGTIYEVVRSHDSAALLFPPPVATITVVGRRISLPRPWARAWQTPSRSRGRHLPASDTARLVPPASRRELRSWSTRSMPFARAAGSPASTHTTRARSEDHAAPLGSAVGDDRHAEQRQLRRQRIVMIRQIGRGERHGVFRNDRQRLIER